MLKTSLTTVKDSDDTLGQSIDVFSLNEDGLCEDSFIEESFLYEED